MADREFDDKRQENEGLRPHAPEAADGEREDEEPEDLDPEGFRLEDFELEDLETEDSEDDWEYDESEPELVWDGSLPRAVEPGPGCAVSFYLDNKLHHAVCLALIGEELLLEHKGASRCFLFTGKVQQIVPRLRVGIPSATVIVGNLKACQYRSVPKRWLQQMMRTGQTWKGIEGGGKTAPAPADLLKGQMELF